MGKVPDIMTPMEKLDQYLDALVANVKTGNMSIADWQWFYRFVTATASLHIRWSTSKVQELLIQRGVDEKRAAELAELYGHCRVAIYCAGKDKPIDKVNVWSQFLG